ncbi:MAG TPA: zinc-binding dehydrogenase [Chloroflexota bacterium]|jgi:threonine dehydrogenase-like Zn-dependent dehydrogenase|nr:zinc-binding dehydrogenase [Chloroflexota bacterium]
MRSCYVSFTAPNRVVLAEEERSPADLEPGEALVRTQHSIVSSGTEGASFTDLVRQMPGWPPTGLEYPRRTGYGNLGEVVAIGDDVRNVAVGDRVLTFAQHAEYTIANVARRGPAARAVDSPRAGQPFALHVPKELDGVRAVATRMAGVSITGLRSSSVQPGDRVVVIGLGLVGNFAAQLFQLAGARVLGLDISERRLEAARACKIRELLDSSGGDPVAAVRDWSGDGAGAEVVVEAIGRSELVMQAVEMTRRHGETILLGSPRARVTADVTPMLTRLHMQAIRMVGALEWTYPVPEASERARFTIEANYKQILGWIRDERLIVDPLISHVLSPRDCQSAYDGLTQRRDEYTAVVFDWSKL